MICVNRWRVSFSSIGLVFPCSQTNGVAES